MQLLNFGHPLTSEQLEAIETAVSHPITTIKMVKTHFDHERPFPAQATALLDTVALSPAEWQTTPLLINPPAHSLIATTLLAELNGRIGYFPAIIRLKPKPNTLPPRFVFAEIINLQAVHDKARENR